MRDRLHPDDHISSRGIMADAASVRAAAGGDSHDVY